jgi:anthranilate phosphoribosyltransferase
MRNVAEVRKSIPHPTIFNRLGPLCNPAKAECQVLGVGDAVLQIKLASALQQLGTKRSIVVRGDDGVDELSLSGPSKVIEVRGDSLTEFSWNPSDFGLQVADRGQLFADCPVSSARCIRDVLSGEHGACRDAVVLNAACALWIAGKSNDPRQCAQLAQDAIDSGAAKELVVKLSNLSHGR